MGPLLFVALIVSLVPIAARADSTMWRKCGIPSTSAKVDIPVSIFTEDAGSARGRGGAFSPGTTAQI